MTLRIGDMSPDFSSETTKGHVQFHEWVGDTWAVFVSHPKDFTPICTTELGLMARLEKDFERRNTKLIGHSIDSVADHFVWLDDIERTQGYRPCFPIIGDENLVVAKAWEMLSESAIPGIRSIADNATVRTVFIVDSDKRIRMMSSYPMSVGRNFDEVLRVLDSLQLNAKYKVATPANWVAGGDVVIPPSITNEEANKLFPEGWKSPTPYLRILSCPKG